MRLTGLVGCVILIPFYGSDLLSVSPCHWTRLVNAITCRKILKMNRDVDTQWQRTS
jgi:hypothetical protein